ncbi:hypothetical protein KGF57_004131 [Candida theae]|uniref:RRM domain-containing protein n=1 Tax=Candida theae TaxID=1198502 RepID=A0AAD5FX83_9ASCO|nr:uncharacterized protein KGF57_004131 [Candida theae]KAI5952925.1 hypothetical protein KGF57_004131 [Candida theae]
MSYYDPYQGMSQQYVGQQYYPQYFSEQQNQYGSGDEFPLGDRGSNGMEGNFNDYGTSQTQFSGFDSGNASHWVNPNSYHPELDVHHNFSQHNGNGNGTFQGNNGFHGIDAPNIGSTAGGEFYAEDSSYLNNNGSNGQIAYGNMLSNEYDQGMLASQSNDIYQHQINGGPNASNAQVVGTGTNIGVGGVGGVSAATPNAAPSRTVYLGNIPSDIQPNELLDYVRSGILENVKIIPAKNCAFISFIDHQSALLFHSDCILKKLNIKGHDIRIGWGKNTSILPAVLEAIQRDGATRNVYLGNLNNPATGQMITEEELREDLSCFGIIDSIKIIPEKGIAFIHFLSILSAVRCVANLPTKEKYLDKKCFYGKDRCAFITKTQQHNAAQYLGLAPGMEHIVTAADREFISSALVQQSAAAAQIATQAGGANNLGNRTVYLGNLHQDSSVEEICNVVRGGLLQSIRFLKERHVCFITFIDPIAAAQFFAMCQLHGLTIHNRRIKVGWGKHSGPLSNALSLAVSNGASRNIYIGNLNNLEFYNPKKLREDFSKFGDIEQINYLEEKNCAFINFVNIANAIKAIDGIKSFPDYKNLKINFGKDRCGNLPRQFQSQGLPLGGGAMGLLESAAANTPMGHQGATPTTNGGSGAGTVVSGSGHGSLSDLGDFKDLREGTALQSGHNAFEITTVGASRSSSNSPLQSPHDSLLH